MSAVLLVEDNDDHAIIAQAALLESDHSFEIDRASSAAECLVMLEKKEYDAIALDYSMPKRNGLEVLQDIMKINYDAPVVMVTSYGDEELAVEAMKHGAYDYISKSDDYLRTFPLVLKKAIEAHKIVREKIKLQAQITRSENILRSISENTAAGLLQIKNDCNISYANRKSRDYLNITDEDQSEKFCSLFGNDGEKRTKCADCILRQCFEGGKTIKREISHNSRDLSITVSIAQVDDAGEGSLAVAVIMDITDQKRIQQQLEQRTRELAKINKELHKEVKQRAQAEEALIEERGLLAQRVEERTAALQEANEQLSRASRLKDEFLASMSHELRTPLSAISGICQILQAEIHGPINDKQVEDLHIIEASGSHLLELINDILDIAKVSSGRLKLDMGPVSVESVCQVSMQFVMQATTEKKLRMSSSVDTAVNELQADERRLKEMLVNLLSNAVKFTPDGGQIGLEVTGNAELQMVDFVVWDTGIGISQEDMELLFQPFVQLDGKLSRQYPGTGLGLALVQKMTELHGGSVSVKSTVGQGSRFTISLPWRRPNQYTADIGNMESVELETCSEQDAKFSVVPAADKETERPLILLAEDDSANAELTSDMLRFKGYDVAVARDGYEAVQKAKEIMPVLILMDIQMPEMNGLEAIRHIRNCVDLECIPIIAVTALTMSGDRDRCLAAGADDYMSKPINMETLTKTIEILLEPKYDKTFVIP